MPDDELFGLADEGRLSDPETLEDQVRRMLVDDKAWALVDNFAGQWLQIRNMADVTPDAEAFSQFDDTLRAAMICEI